MGIDEWPEAHMNPRVGKCGQFEVSGSLGVKNL